MQSVTCMDFDRRRLVTGGLDRIINIYDMKSADNIGHLEGHKVAKLNFKLLIFMHVIRNLFSENQKGGIRCLYLFANRLCSGSWDLSVIVWNMLTFEAITTISSTFHDSVSCLYFDYDYL
jgi:WD40 repeat protein